MSPGRTTWVSHPYGAGCAVATMADAGAAAWTEAAGARPTTALMGGVLSTRREELRVTAKLMWRLVRM